MFGVSRKVNEVVPSSRLRGNESSNDARLGVYTVTQQTRGLAHDFHLDRQRGPASMAPERFVLGAWTGMLVETRPRSNQIELGPELGGATARIISFAVWTSQYAHSQLAHMAEAQ